MENAVVQGLVSRLSPGLRPTLVGIGGFGCAGKTTLARSISGAQVVATDGFWDGEGFDLARLRREVLEPLLAVRPASFAVRDWASGVVTVTTIEPVGIVVIEGVCALHRTLRDAYALRIWLEVEADVRLARAVARDGESARSMWLETWMPREERYAGIDDPVACAAAVLDGDGRLLRPPTGSSLGA